MTDELHPLREFRIEGFSAGSYTGAVLFLALRTLFPDCRVQAKLGAVAMPKGVFAALMAAAVPGRCRVHLIHAEEDMLRDWQPSQVERHVISHRLEHTLVTESDKWMGSSSTNICTGPTGSTQPHRSQTQPSGSYSNSRQNGSAT